MITVHKPNLANPLRVPQRPTNFGVSSQYVVLDGQEIFQLHYYLVLPFFEDVFDDSHELNLRGSLRQLGTYPFDGNSVEHISVSGDIFPSSTWGAYGSWAFEIPMAGSPFGLMVILAPSGAEVITDHNSLEVSNPVGRSCWCRYDRGRFSFTSFFTSPYDSTSSPRIPLKITIWDRVNMKFAYSTKWVYIPGSKNWRGTVKEYWQVAFDTVRSFADSYSGSPSISYTLEYPDLNLEFSEYRLRNRIVRLYQDYKSKFPWAEIWASHESSLAKDVILGQKVTDVNFYNWIDKISKWGGGIRAVAELGESLSDPKKWASAYLSNRFGDRLEYKSSLDLLDAIWEEFLTVPLPTKYYGSRTSRSRITEDFGGGELTCSARLVCKDGSMSAVMSTIKGLMDWGAWPSLVNAYDMVPFSFVLDWTTSFSTLLENIDTMAYRLYLVVALYERSISYSKRVDLLLGTSSARSNFVVKYYRRWGDKTCPEVQPLEGWDPEAPSLVNLVDGVALLAQLR